jgi:hypothetical protein
LDATDKSKIADEEEIFLRSTRILPFYRRSRKKQFLLAL